MSAEGTSGAGAVLGIDTATDEPGVALVPASRTSVRAIGWRAAFLETAPAAEALLREAGIGWSDLGALAVPAGPGSFTGLRVGATLALGLARGRGIALCAIPTLEAVAEAWADAARVCAVLDARRGRWYAALCERDGAGWRVLEGPADLAPEAVPAFARGAPVVGPGAAALAGTAPAARGPAPVAAALAALAARDPARHRLAAPEELRLRYARSGVDP